MEAITASPERLSDVDLARVIEQLHEDATVELKLTLPQGGCEATVDAFNLDPVDAQVRQVYLFDTPDLDMHDAGLVARARRVQGKDDDSIVRLGGVAPDSARDAIGNCRKLTLEVDAAPSGYLCAASLKAKLAAPLVRAVACGERPIRKLFGKEQRALLQEHSPAWFDLGDLMVMGPIFVLKLRFPAGSSSGGMVAELWLYPGGARVLELSRKTSRDEGLRAAIETREFLKARGVDLGGLQQASMRSALEFFAQDFALTAQRRHAGSAPGCVATARRDTDSPVQARTRGVPHGR